MAFTCNLSSSLLAILRDSHPSVAPASSQRAFSQRCDSQNHSKPFKTEERNLCEVCLLKLCIRVVFVMYVTYLFVGSVRSVVRTGSENVVGEYA